MAQPITKLLSGAARTTNGLRPRVERWRWQRYRRSFIRRTKVAAAWADARVDLQVAKDVKIGKTARVSFKPGSDNTLHMGYGVRIGEGVQINLRGGKVLLDNLAEVRAGGLLNISGTYSMGHDAGLSWECTIHCSQSVTLGNYVGFAERVTVTDSTHYFTEPDVKFYYNTKPGTVEIGDNCWLGAGAVITRNSVIGSHCIIAANSMVAGEVPSGSVAAGVPAVARPLQLPWEQEKAKASTPAAKAPARRTRTKAAP
jgi:acetyltransferase-like isoleucine patch superfamily enzyme